MAPLLVFVVGLPLHDDRPGTCDAWPGCSASAREQWSWTAEPWVVTGIMLAAFLMVAALVAPWFRARPVVLRRVVIVALCLLVPVAALFGVVGLIVLGTDCSTAAWICFGGPSDALLLSSPGLVLGTVAALLAVGLARRGTAGGHALLTWTAAGLTACLVAVAAAFLASGVLALVEATFGG